MGVLSDPKKEKFAQLLARGMPVSDAYVQAGWKANTGNASSMKKRDEIQQRVQEIIDARSSRGQQELDDFIEESGISPSYIVAQLFDIAKQAKEAGQFHVAKDSIKDIGRELFGMFHDKKEIKVDQNVSIGRSPSVPELANLFEKIGRAAGNLIDAEFSEVADEGGNLLSGPDAADDGGFGASESVDDGEEPPGPG